MCSCGSTASRSRTCGRTAKRSRRSRRATRSRSSSCATAKSGASTWCSASAKVPLMDRDEFKEALLSVMERKTHWSSDAFANGGVARDKMYVHFEQEYGAFVRDFPVLV